LDVGLPDDADNTAERVNVPEYDAFLKLVEALSVPELNDKVRLDLVAQLRNLVQSEPAQPVFVVE